MYNLRSLVLKKTYKMGWNQLFTTGKGVKERKPTH